MGDDDQVGRPVAVAVTRLTQGANAPVAAPGTAAPPVVVDVEWPVDSSSDGVRLAVLACDERGSSLGPEHVVVHAEPSERGGRRWFSARLDLAAVPDHTHQLALVLVDDTSWGPRTGLVITIDGPASPQPLVFEVTGLDAELGVALVEFYRRNGAWKVRAVGRGIPGGAAGLAPAYGATLA